MSGVVPSSENELSSRLTNLMNICEIAANNSTLNDFDCPGWQIAKTYGDRVFHDVETGQKTWEELPVNIMADTFLHAKDTVIMKAKKAVLPSDIDLKTGKKKKKKSDEGKGKVCTTYNTFRTGDGCAGAKVKLQHSNLNIELFRYYLQGYDDLEILSYLEYGFPIGLTQVFFLEPLTKNHSSAYEYYSYVDSFIAKGISLAECTGPWPEAPIDPLMVSPLMTADKPPDSRRSVFDASYGDFSLNQNTPVLHSHQYWT